MGEYDGMSWAERTALLPNGRKLVESGYELVGVGAHRDSHAYERSNLEVATEWLSSSGDIGRPWDDEGADGPLVGVAHFRHWAVGWVDELMYRPGEDEATDSLVSELRERLEQYPLLDEEHALMMEWEENHPEDGVCYSEDGDDCGCRYA